MAGASPVTAAEAPPGVSRALLTVLSGNMLLDAVEVSAAIVALPAIGRDLRLSTAVVIWVVGAFAIGFGGLLLTGRRIVARWGERRVYLVAVLIFAVASIVGALATSAALLIATRVVKGGCAALTAPTGLAIIGRSVPEGPPRNRAISTYGFIGACGFSVGLLLSGLTTEVSWRWTFLLPAPVAIVLFLLGVRLIPDPVGVSAGGHRVTVSGRLARSALVAAALNGSFWGLLITWTFRFTGESGWGSLPTGLALLPASLPAALAAPFSRRLLGRFGSSRLIVSGTPLVPLGIALTWYDGPGYALGVLPGLLMIGAGFALCFGALHVQALSGLRTDELGKATAWYQTAVQLGGVLVLSLVTTPSDLPALGIATTAGAVGFLVAITGINASGRRSHQR